MPSSETQKSEGQQRESYGRSLGRDFDIPSQASSKLASRPRRAAARSREKPGTDPHRVEDDVSLQIA
jgi:hypothetical protein